jgi:hypothetical protein
MSSSYPFLTIARQLGVPYSTVVTLADFWRCQNNATAPQSIEIDYLDRIIRVATIAEQERRNVVDK